MSLEQIVTTLTNLGLTRVDAEVYVYTEVNGPQLIEDLKMVFRYSEDQIYTSLKTLIGKRLITARKRADTIFYAIPFEKAFDLLTKVEKEQSQV